MGGDKLLEQIFNLKFTVKQLNKSAVKCEKDHKAEINKCRKAMEAKQFEIASTYAENAIRKRTEQLNYIKLASRLDAVVCRLDTQSKMQTVNKAMAGIVASLDKALSSNNMERIAGVMQQFEKQFENLDVQTDLVSGVMNQQAALSTPADDVRELLQQVADENQMNLKIGLPSTSGMVVTQKEAAPSEAGTEDLSARLAELKR